MSLEQIYYAEKFHADECIELMKFMVEKHKLSPDQIGKIIVRAENVMDNVDYRNLTKFIAEYQKLSPDQIDKMADYAEKFHADKCIELMKFIVEKYKLSSDKIAPIMCYAEKFHADKCINLMKFIVEKYKLSPDKIDKIIYYVNEINKRMKGIELMKFIAKHQKLSLGQIAQIMCYAEKFHADKCINLMKFIVEKYKLSQDQIDKIIYYVNEINKRMKGITSRTSKKIAKLNQKSNQTKIMYVSDKNNRLLSFFLPDVLSFLQKVVNKNPNLSTEETKDKNSIRLSQKKPPSDKQKEIINQTGIAGRSKKLNWQQHFISIKDFILDVELNQEDVDKILNFVLRDSISGEKIDSVAINKILVTIEHSSDDCYFSLGECRIKQNQFNKNHVSRILMYLHIKKKEETKINNENYIGSYYKLKNKIVGKGFVNKRRVSGIIDYLTKFSISDLIQRNFVKFVHLIRDSKLLSINLEQRKNIFIYTKNFDLNHFLSINNLITDSEFIEFVYRKFFNSSNNQEPIAREAMFIAQYKKLSQGDIIKIIDRSSLELMRFIVQHRKLFRGYINKITDCAEKLGVKNYISVIKIIIQYQNLSLDNIKTICQFMTKTNPNQSFTDDNRLDIIKLLNKKYLRSFSCNPGDVLVNLACALFYFLPVGDCVFSGFCKKVRLFIENKQLDISRVKQIYNFFNRLEDKRYISELKKIDSFNKLISKNETNFTPKSVTDILNKPKSIFFINRSRSVSSPVDNVFNRPKSIFDKIELLQKDKKENVPSQDGGGGKDFYVKKYK